MSTRRVFVGRIKVRRYGRVGRIKMLKICGKIEVEK